MIQITKRALVRIVSFATAIILVMAAYTYNGTTEAVNVKRQMQYTYLRAVQELSASLENIKNSLNKGMYSNSPQMMAELSSKLWSDASNAKVSMAQLPVEDIDLSNTYKFLSQVGNYSKAMAKKHADGEEITDEDKENIVALYDYAKSISDSLWSIQDQISSGHLTFGKAARTANEVGAAEQSPVSASGGFADVEAGFDSYPTLIYDGPFSDHIMQKKPLMLEGLEEISREEALEYAVKVSGAQDLRLASLEEGNMPSYLFKGENSTVSVTRAGGLYSYMLSYRTVTEEKMSVEQCIAIAENYLHELGMVDVTNTYYETQGGVCIINFAGAQDGVTLYTDLVKVGVAMDNGEILSYDARGYITNHTARELGEPGISAEEAAQMLSPYLNLEKTNLCVIPSEGLEERYCYELECRNSSGQQILVYINVEDGREEQILILQINEHGMLTV